MKKLFFIGVLLLSTLSFAQSQNELVNHYQKYYEQMRSQADIQGIINALTHLNILVPNKHRLDTLAYVYASNNQHIQALNTIGIEEDPADSDLAIQVKASSFKALNEPKRAIAQFTLLNERKSSPYLLYEMADLKIQIGEDASALTDVEEGLKIVNDQMMYSFYERQQPYQVPLKAAFTHLKGLITYNKDRKTQEAIDLIDQALKIAPEFNLASLTKQALEAKLKEENAAEDKK